MLLPHRADNRHFLWTVSFSTLVPRDFLFFLNYLLAFSFSFPYNLLECPPGSTDFAVFVGQVSAYLTPLRSALQLPLSWVRKVSLIAPSSPDNRFSHLPRILLRASAALVPLVLLVALLTALFLRHSPNDSLSLNSFADQSGAAQWQQPAPQTATVASTRPIFPYSIVSGGVRSGKELQAASSADPVVAQHYSDFKVARARTIQLDHPVAMYVSYRRGNNVFWTRNRMTIPAGETLISDGENLARTRCANRLSAVAVKPIAASDPTTEELNQPSFVPPFMAAMLPGESAFRIPGPPLGPPVTPDGPGASGAPPSAGGVSPPLLPPILFPGGPPVVPHTPPPPPPPVSTPEPGSLALLVVGLGVTLLLVAIARRP